MSKLNRKLALVLALVLCFALSFGGLAETTETAEDESIAVYATSTFGQKFSPFFYTTVYDGEVVDQVVTYLLASDRGGAVINEGIAGTTIDYNGTDYEYLGNGDVEVVMNDDGSVDYNLTMRDDIVFSDGEPVTIDDVIFSMYVLCDPTYDGSSTLYAQPIEGMEAYRSGMDTLLNLIFNAGRENTDFTFFTEEQQTGFWEKYDAATTALAEEIVAYCVDNGYNEEGDIIGAAANWGFSIEENSIASFAASLEASYGADVRDMVATEHGYSSIEELFPDIDEYGVGVRTGSSAASITGIRSAAVPLISATVSFGSL